MAAGRLHPVRCSVQVGHAYGMPGLPCHAGATSAKCFLEIDGRLPPAFGKRANEMCHDNDGGNTRNGQKPPQRDRTRLSLVPKCTGLNQVEAEAGNPASKRARKRIRQGKGKGKAR